MRSIVILSFERDRALGPLVYGGETATGETIKKKKTLNTTTVLLLSSTLESKVNYMFVKSTNSYHSTQARELDTTINQQFIVFPQSDL
jgi:hypothetical protein